VFWLLKRHRKLLHSIRFSYRRSHSHSEQWGRPATHIRCFSVLTTDRNVDPILKPRQFYVNSPECHFLRPSSYSGLFPRVKASGS
jgi:hypothetical protein